MKLIKPSFEFIEQECTIKNHKMDESKVQINAQLIEGIYKQIELAGRTCYKSEDKITETSAKEFVDRMIKSGHGAMLEHGTVYLFESFNYPGPDGVGLLKYKDNKYSKFQAIGREINSSVPDWIDGYYVTTNLRVLVENGWLDDLKYICELTEYHEKRVTVRFICDRVTGESFLRHRAIDEDHLTVEGEVTREMEKDIDSFARESTRYCNYTKDKFDNQFTIINPPEFYNEDINKSMECWGVNDDQVFRSMCVSIASECDDDFSLLDTWYFANLATQWSYNRLIKLGWKPEQARRIIPLDIKSELVMTAFVSDWGHFFELRCAPNAHLQARELAIPLKEEFIKRGLI